MEVMLTLFLSGFEVGNNIILSIESLFMLFRIIQSFYISIALIIIALAGTQFWGICIKHSSSDEELGPGPETMLSNNCMQQIKVLYLIQFSIRLKIHYFMPKTAPSTSNYQPLNDRVSPHSPVQR